MYKKYFPLTFFVLVLSMLSCQKLERDNPLDEQGTAHNSSNGYEFSGYYIGFESVSDNIITAGENLSIGIKYWANSCLSARCSISSNNPYVYCETGTAYVSYGDSYHTLSYPTNVHGFAVSVSSDAPNGTNIPIDVTFTDGLGAQSYGAFSLVVGSSWQNDQ